MCIIKGCDSEIYAASLCSKHYNRLRTRGTLEDGPRARAPLETRFWRYVTKGLPSECWEWHGSKNLAGYGTISTGGREGKRIHASRASFLIHNGYLPDSDGKKYVVRHTCDNPACVNPAHLQLGTQEDNMRDVAARGRRLNTYQLKCDKHPNARMTAKQVLEARERVERGDSMAAIAREYGVTRQAVRYACKKGWAAV